MSGWVRSIPVSMSPIVAPAPRFTAYDWPGEALMMRHGSVGPVTGGALLVLCSPYRRGLGSSLPASPAAPASWASHPFDGSALSYSSCQFHHTYGAVWG
jgi:hypothetical protein